jgi:hypothetical protein
MKKRRSGCSLAMLSTAVCLALVLSRLASADTALPGAEPLPWKDAMKVHELLFLDTEQALLLAREKQRAIQKREPALAGAVTASSGIEPELVAIYGVGKKLLAEVRSQGRSLVYINGKPQPVGTQQGTQTQAYELKGISGRCVRLERDGKGLTLCLNHIGETVQ